MSVPPLILIPEFPPDWAPVKGTTMNCVQGDIAIVVGPCVPSNLGVLVEVIEPWGGKDAEPNWWWVRSLGGPRLRRDGKTSMEGSVADSGLRPIRPGVAALETDSIVAAVA